MGQVPYKVSLSCINEKNRLKYAISQVYTWNFVTEAKRSCTAIARLEVVSCDVTCFICDLRFQDSKFLSYPGYKQKNAVKSKWLQVDIVNWWLVGGRNRWTWYKIICIYSQHLEHFHSLNWTCCYFYWTQQHNKYDGCFGLGGGLALKQTCDG